MIKGLAKDSVFYGIAGGLQKLVPFLLIPLITAHLGGNAFKLYDIAFVYAYLFSWLIILGQDNAASIYYFSSGDGLSKKEVLLHGLVIQLACLFFSALLFFPFRTNIGALLFGTDPPIEAYWLKALLIIPGHIVLNYVFNILIWEKNKTPYLLLNLLQVLVTLAGAALVIFAWHSGIDGLFRVLILSTTVTAAVGIFWVRKSFPRSMHLRKELLQRLAWVGLPFALTSFFHQLLPSIDRNFLLRYHYNAELPQYILAVKMGSLLGIGLSAFVLAFTPYSMSKINEEGGDKDLSLLFRFVSVAAFAAVPVLLLFRQPLVSFFADASYTTTVRLLPLFFFSWVFDLLYYFSILGVYKSKKSYLVLLLFVLGVILISVLNILLIPALGVYGAAVSLLITKLVLFFLPLLLMKKYFRLRIEPTGFFFFAALAALCSYLIYVWKWYQSAAVLAILVATAFLYLHKLIQKHKHVLAL